MWLALLLAVLLAFPASAIAKEDPNWAAVCAKVKDLAPPASDKPDAAAKKALLHSSPDPDAVIADDPECNSEALYYGIGREPDDTKARQCAFMEVDADAEPVFGGSAVLMMIYANGRGVPRNLDLAMHYACALAGPGSAEMENELRIGHLEQMRNDAAKPIDLCDDITSGFMEGHCAAHAQRLEAAKRDARYASRIAALPPEAKTAFAKLRAAAASFREARGTKETDMSGTARGAMAIETEEDFEKEFGEVLEAVSKGTLPKSDANADAALNKTYKNALAAKRAGTVRAEGIRETERLWIPYREAWIAFAKIAWPKTDATALRADLTRRRTQELSDLGD